MKNTFDHPDFPSGEWVGFYLLGGRHRQEMRLCFREGLVTGFGVDDVGRFLIRGEFDAKTKDVWWMKTYLGSHQVFYKGYREIKGIWGIWEITNASRGGFHVWPKEEGEKLELMAEVAERAPEPAVRTTENSPSKRSIRSSPPSGD